jgi:hypothetical protein
MQHPSRTSSRCRHTPLRRAVAIGLACMLGACGTGPRNTAAPAPPASPRVIERDLSGDLAMTTPATADRTAPSR